MVIFSMSSAGRLSHHSGRRDHAQITTVWKQLMTEKVFAVCTPLIHEAVTTDDWSELTRRVPGLVLRQLCIDG